MSDRIIFRADGNGYVGAGHVMRCLSIADAAARMGEKCLFITASSDFAALIGNHGHEVLVLDSDFRDMESEKAEEYFEKYCPRAFFADSYYVTKAYLDRLLGYCREQGCTLVCMDDVQAFPYPCDVLVNYNVYAKEKAYRTLYSNIPYLPKLLLGTEYAPLRAEFADLPGRIVKREAREILVSTGGADTEHMAVALIRAAAAQKNKKLSFHFVIGAMNADKDLIRQMAEEWGNIVLHENVSEMSGLMQSMDAAVSAAGSTLYELCATQTPTVTYILADNQIPGGEGFDSREIMQNCGDVRELGREELAGKLIHEVVELAANYGKRRQLARRMRTVVDGKGAERIVEYIDFLKSGR